MPTTPEQRATLRTWLADGDVRRWRTTLRVTQVEAAQLIGVTPSTYARWEQHAQVPRWPHDLDAYRQVNKWRRAVEVLDNATKEQNPALPSEDTPGRPGTDSPTEK